MNIERETIKHDDGSVTVTTRVNYRPGERKFVAEITEGLKDLAGFSQAGGVDMYDTTAMIAMTDARKKMLVDAAQMIEEITLGD